MRTFLPLFMVAISSRIFSTPYSSTIKFTMLRALAVEDNHILWVAGWASIAVMGIKLPVRMAN